jgi:glycine/D-amino acid oxidase-like deaminating enzyme/nitrite reductase/ring-hydroxylating ferredoxin subunit
MVTAGDAPERPALDGSTAVDVCVVGAGITGLTTAYLLQEAGASVCVVERDRVSTGVTGYTTGKVTSLHRLIYADLEDRLGTEGAAVYAAANEAGVGLVAQIAETRGIQCDVERLPALTYAEGREHVGAIEREVAAAHRAGLRVSYVTDTDLPYEISAAVRLDEQLHFHPRKYCQGLAEALTSVYERTEATGVDEEQEGCVVRTESGEVRAGHVVLATQLPFVDRGLYFSKAHPARSYAIAGRVDRPPRGMYISADAPTRSVRPHFSDAGSWLIVGGEGHRVGEEDDTESCYARLVDWARERFGMEAELRWSAQDYMPADDVPFIGRATHRSNRLWVATGFKKWGLSTGSFAGLLLRDLIAGRGNPWADVFDSTRSELRRAPFTLMRDNLDVAKHAIGDRIADLRPRRVDELGPGEGDIVRGADGVVAAYRDEDGSLHQVSPVCTHLGCHVRFNTAERSWDCPCHGSRFTIDGEVLQGPAVEPLGVVKGSLHDAG